MKLSIMQKTPVCYVCGTTRNLHRHHALFGTANHRLADEDGLWIYLCIYHHTGDHGVHHDKNLNMRIKQDAQNAWEETYGRREDFIKRYGRNYLE